LPNTSGRPAGSSTSADRTGLEPCIDPGDGSEPRCEIEFQSEGPRATPRSRVPLHNRASSDVLAAAGHREIPMRFEPTFFTPSDRNTRERDRLPRLVSRTPVRPLACLPAGQTDIPVKPDDNLFARFRPLKRLPCLVGCWKPLRRREPRIRPRAGSDRKCARTDRPAFARPGARGRSRSCRRQRSRGSAPAACARP
jgi:hypothetical protein